MLGHTVLFEAYFIVYSKSLLDHKALFIKGLKPQATGVVKNMVYENFINMWWKCFKLESEIVANWLQVVATCRK